MHVNHGLAGGPESLVRDGEVHRRVYTDPAIFALEQERIFARSWQFLAHDSQLPETGDFLTTTVAGRPVLLVRAKNGDLKAFFNRCPHRGALIMHRATGNSRRLTCSYHGWTFDHQGSLLALPMSEGYANTAVAENPEAYGLQALPAVDSYRGFWFAHLNPDGVSLRGFLGEVACNIDNMIDRAPDGTIAVMAREPYRIMMRNNWKVYLENLHDGAHAVPTHQSSIQPAADVARKPNHAWSRFQAEVIAANAQSPAKMKALRVNCYGRGHSDMMAFRKTRPDNPEYQEYERRLSAAAGSSRLDSIVGINRHNAIIYPTLTVQPNYMQLRVVVPLDAESTRLDIWIFRLGGAPDWINQRTLVYGNTIHSPASLVRADDMENGERVQIGLRQSVETDWVSMHREQGCEPGPHGVSHAMSERYIRNQYDAWLHYMGAAA